MNNLFIIENLKVIIRILPILKIQVHQNEVSFVIKKNHLIPTLTFFKNHTKYQFKNLFLIKSIKSINEINILVPQSKMS